jgi:hypothetical protein
MTMAWFGILAICGAFIGVALIARFGMLPKGKPGWTVILIDGFPYWIPPRR